MSRLFDRDELQMAVESFIDKHKKELLNCEIDTLREFCIDVERHLRSVPMFVEQGLDDLLKTQVGFSTFTVEGDDLIE